MAKDFQTLLRAFKHRNVKHSKIIIEQHHSNAIVYSCKPLDKFKCHSADKTKPEPTYEVHPSVGNFRPSHDALSPMSRKPYRLCITYACHLCPVPWAEMHFSYMLCSQNANCCRKFMQEVHNKIDIDIMLAEK